MQSMLVGCTLAVQVPSSGDAVYPDLKLLGGRIVPLHCTDVPQDSLVSCQAMLHCLHTQAYDFACHFYTSSTIAPSLA